MSIILDALRKVEREKPAPARMAGVDRRAAENTAAPADGFFHGRYSGLMAVAALAAFAGGFCFAAVSAGPNPLRAETAEAMTMNDAAGTVSTAVESKDKARYGGEEMRNGVQLSAHEEPPDAATYPMKEQGAGPLGEKGEISPRTTAGPDLSFPVTRKEPAGIEPPVRHRVQAAPAPVFVLDGIVFHNDPDKRAALLREPGGESVLLNIGGRLGGCRVAAIGESGITLTAAGGKKIELALE